MSGTSLQPNDKPTQVTWLTNLEKVQFCKGMLTMHGFLTDGENRKVNERIDKWFHNTAKAEKGGLR